MRRLEIDGTVRQLPHGKLESVEFIAIGGTKARVDLPGGEEGEIAVKRSLLDDLLLKRARELGAEVRDGTIVSAVTRERWGDWKIDIVQDVVRAHFLVAADGRNSTIARLRNLLPSPERERVALQSHVPLPNDFGNRVVLEFLPQGYSGQAPVNDHQLNLCLVGVPASIGQLKIWAEKRFHVPPDHPWRTITPLTRAPIRPVHENLFFVGDTARVVEPFTGEGIYYALHSGELAAEAIAKMIQTEDRQPIAGEFERKHSAMYEGRLWINRLARRAVLAPRIASMLVHAAKIQPSVLRLLTNKIVARP
jgi:flavin-dependent dehydrogenase